MELTEKCKEDFEKWWSNQFNPALTGEMHHFGIYYRFEYLIDSMQYGVYVDFFDSVGLNILLTVEFDWGYIITEHKYQEIEEVKKWYDTRSEAQTEAIKKANEIYNYAK